MCLQQRQAGTFKILETCVCFSYLWPYFPPYLVWSFPLSCVPSHLCRGRGKKLARDDLPSFISCSKGNSRGLWAKAVDCQELQDLRFDPTVHETFRSETKEFMTHPWHSKQYEQHHLLHSFSPYPQVPQEWHIWAQVDSCTYFWVLSGRGTLSLGVLSLS